MPASSFDHLFGDADGLLGSVFLDSAAPTLSAASLHHLVVSSGLVEISQAKATCGHWRTETQCNLIRPFFIGRALPNSQLI
jgi:hypothetical protein